jgi:hypothetical protein
MGRLSLVSSSPVGQACEVETVTTSWPAAADATVPVSVSAKGVPGFAEKRSL